VAQRPRTCNSEKRRTGAGFYQRTLITNWLACKIKGITGNERLHSPGAEASEAVRGRLKQARPAFDISDALGGEGIFLVLSKDCYTKLTKAGATIRQKYLKALAKDLPDLQRYGQALTPRTFPSQQCRDSPRTVQV